MDIMSPANDWEKFFEEHAPFYMENVFTKNTLAEVDFLVAEFELRPGASILDMGCGTGRHAVELARRGYRVTGVDLSAAMLAQARQAAEAAGVEVEWVRCDAARFRAEKAFDAAVCLCEGAFCLLGADDDPVERDLGVLKNISAACKPGAPFVLTALSACRCIRRSSREDAAAGTFDPLTIVQAMVEEIDTPEGKKSFRTRERVYVPTELTLLCRLAGLEVEHIGGGTAGDWGKRPLDLDEYEIMVIAGKAAA